MLEITQTRYVAPELPSNESERLAALHAISVLDTDPSDALDRIVQLVARALRVPIALVSLVDEDRQWFKARVGLDATETPRAVSFCGHAILQDNIFVVLDAHADPRFAENPLVTSAPHVRFYAGAPLRTSNGQAIGTLCAIDSTSRASFPDDAAEMLKVLADTVVSHLELQSTHTELASRHLELARYEAIINASTDMIGIAGTDGRAILVNPAGRAMIGIDANADVSQYTIADFHPPAVALRILEEGLPVAVANGAWQGETAIRSFTGAERPMDQVVLAHRGVDGDVAFFSTIARDISQRAEIQRLMELQRLKDAFVATVSHELRTPLTAIQGSLGLLANGAVGMLAPAASELVELASRNTQRLTRIVNDILDIEKIRGGKLAMDFAPIDARDPIRLAMQTVGALATARNISMECDCHLGTESVVLGDVERLTQVYVNLLGNAIKFAPENSNILVRTERTNDEIAVHVIDHGPGIRVEDHARLFEPFWQSDDSDARTVGGSGLGLAISQAIVQRHQGEIEVQSELGAGADFIVRLPLHRANALSTATQLTEPTNNRPSGGAA